MDFLNQKLLFKGEELVPIENVMTESSTVIYYFTNMDCTPCRLFDEKIKKVYLEAQKRHLEVLFIVVSSDEEEIVMMEGLKKYYPDWYAIRYEDDLRIILRYSYDVTHVPQVIPVRSDGEIITRQGRKEIEEIGINVLVTWPEKMERDKSTSAKPSM